MSKPANTPLCTDLILVAEKRKCATCGEPTFWATRRQPKFGMCIHHSRPHGNGRELEMAMAVFPTAGVTAVKIPRYRRGEYVRGWVRRSVPMVTFYGPQYGRPAVPAVGHHVARGWGLPADAGPCVSCGALIRLYGENGHPLCLDCEDEKKEGKRS